MPNTRTTADPEAPDQISREAFEERGYAGPFPIFTPDECRRIVRRLQNTAPPLDWHKGHAAASRLYYELGARDEIVDRVASVIGGEVMLWGASVVRREPGRAHPWHTDVETAAAPGRTVTVWIGLENTDRRSSLMLISYSHRFGASLQEVALEAGKRRGDSSTEEVLEWARRRDPRSEVGQLPMGDGDALIFDGRLWHGSLNTRASGARTALLLQYATPDTPIRIPDLQTNFEWPFRFLDSPRPACIMVRGTDGRDVNRIVPPPSLDADATTAERIGSSWVRTLPPKLEEDEESGWNIYRVFRGASPCMGELGVHVSVLSAGVRPHEPHEHREEEIIILLSGAAEIVREDGPGGRTTVERVGRGSFVYHGAYDRHTIESVGAEPAIYLIFKWAGPSDGRGESALRTSTFQFEESAVPPGVRDAAPMEKTRIFDARTDYLRKLHSHLTTLQPGGGYEPHADPYDVALVMLSGTVETLGRHVGSPGAIFYAAGKPHGIRNVGSTPASYLVFEFHGGDPNPD